MSLESDKPAEELGRWEERLAGLGHCGPIGQGFGSSLKSDGSLCRVLSRAETLWDLEHPPGYDGEQMVRRHERELRDQTGACSAHSVPGPGTGGGKSTALDLVPGTDDQWGRQISNN